MKKLFVFVAMVLVCVFAFGCTKKNSAEGDGAADTSSKKYTLKVGTVLADSDPIVVALKSFQAKVQERTNGNVVVQIYSGSQLGADEDVLEQAKFGDGVGVITDAGRMANYIKDFGILLGPYLADDYDGVLKVFETSVYNEFAEQFAQDGFKILSFNYFQGSRHLYTKTPIRKPEDLAGQRLRSSGSAVVTATVESMGANSTVLPWSEAYQALQQKVIEAVEVHHSAAVGSSIFEVTSYMSPTNHFQLLTGLVISNDWFESLPAEYQTILVEESFNAGKLASEDVIAKDSEFLQVCIDGGIVVVDDVDIAAFKAAAESTYDKLGLRELKDRIDAELGR